MSLSTSQRLRLVKTRADNQVSELRQRSTERRNSGALKLSERVKQLDDDIKNMTDRNKAFVERLQQHREATGRQLVAEMDAHEDRMRELRKQFKAERQRVSQKEGRQQQQH